MTFNTTSLPLARALRQKLLLVREPLRPLPSVPGNQPRYLIVTPQIDALLDGHLLFGTFPDRSAEQLIGIYSAGQLIRVSRKKTKAKPDVEQIEGPDEVWAICPRKPPPGWRLLGRFYEPHVFIALRPWDKNKLFGQYPQASQEVIDDWTNLFGAQAPYRGTDIGDYVGGVFRDVDQP